MSEPRTVVIIGASIAGCAAAAASVAHFDRVVILDRDSPIDDASRRGASHARQFHTLTAGGRKDLEELFPGVTEELRAKGVPYIDVNQEVRYASRFGWFPRRPSQLRTLQARRVTLEQHLRARVRTLPGVEIIEGVSVLGVLIEDGRAVGVRADRDGDVRQYPADAVIDASGRSSRAPEWLTEAGYPAPKERTVNAHWGYATTYVRVPKGWDPGYAALYVGPTVLGEGPVATRGAAMWRQEDDIWVVTAQGCAGDIPPIDEQEFLGFISNFGTMEFADFVRAHERIAPIEGWRNTANRLRVYDALERRPERFIVTGDAVAAFNPIYGQGMTIAARSALVLRAALHDHFQAHTDLDGFSATFQSMLSDVIEPAWTLSTGSDHAVPGVSVDGVVATVDDGSSGAYMDRVLALATEDPEITLNFRETAGLVRGREWLQDDGLRQRIHDEWDRLGALTRDLEAQPS